MVSLFSFKLQCVHLASTLNLISTPLAKKHSAQLFDTGIYFQYNCTPCTKLLGKPQAMTDACFLLVTLELGRNSSKYKSQRTFVISVVVSCLLCSYDPNGEVVLVINKMSCSNILAKNIFDK